MEENVDRGMWSVVAILAAITLGGIAFLVYPKITDRFVNESESSLDGQVINEKPAWEKDVDGKVPDWKVELNPGEYEEPEMPTVPDPVEPEPTPQEPEPEIPEYEKYQWDTSKNYGTDKLVNNFGSWSSSKLTQRQAPKEAMNKDYSRNYIVNSNDVPIYSNHSVEFPTKREFIKSSSGDFTRVQRVSPEKSPKIFSVYTAFDRGTHITEDFFNEVSDHQPVYVSFEARANYNTDMSFYVAAKTGTVDHNPLMGHDRRHKITKNWQKYELVITPPNTGWSSVKTLRVNPRQAYGLSEQEIKNLQLDVKNYRLSRKPGKWYPAFEDVAPEDKTVQYIHTNGGKAPLKALISPIYALGRGERAFSSATVRNDGPNKIWVTGNYSTIGSRMDLESGGILEYAQMAVGNGSTNFQFRFENRNKDDDRLYVYFKDFKMYKELKNTAFSDMLDPVNIIKPSKDVPNFVSDFKRYEGHFLTYKDVWGSRWESEFPDNPKQYGWHLVEKKGLPSDQVLQIMNVKDSNNLSLFLNSQIANGVGYEGFGKIIGLDKNLQYKKELDSRIDWVNKTKKAYDISDVDYVVMHIPYAHEKAWVFMLD